MNLSSSLAKGGEVFLLDMGEPVKIIDLAKSLTKLHEQANTSSQIQIIFTGQKPGEKLKQRLPVRHDSSEPTSHPKIQKGFENYCDYETLKRTCITPLLNSVEYNNSQSAQRIIMACIGNQQQNLSDTKVTPIRSTTGAK